MSAVPKLRFKKFNEGWKESRTDLIAPLQRGFDLPNQDHVEGRFPVVYSNGISKYHIEPRAKGPGVVTGRSGTIGKVTFVEEDYWPHNTSLWVTDFKGNDPRFIYYFYLRFGLDRLSTGSGVPTLNRNDVHVIKSRVPSLSEQKKIADFLGTVDKKIAGLRERERLLTHYKKGVMQKIFSQTLRFKADDGSDFPDWEAGRVSDIGYFYYGKSAPKHSLSEDAPTPCVRYGELYSTYDEVVGEIQSYTNIPPKNLKFSVGGEVLVPRVGEDPLEFANCSYLPHKDVAIGEMISVFNTEHNGLFWTYYFNNKLNRDIARMVEGGSVANLYFRYLEPLKISIPSIPEQQKIADFLSAIDEKITAVSAQITQMQDFKKGLLQQMFV